MEERLRHDEKEPTDVLVKLPPNHYVFTDVFNRKTAENLPPYRPYDYKIILEDKLTMGHGLIYNMLGHHLQLVDWWKHGAHQSRLGLARTHGVFFSASIALDRNNNTELNTVLPSVVHPINTTSDGIPGSKPG